jgi:hypothetical protein
MSVTFSTIETKLVDGFHDTVEFKRSMLTSPRKNQKECILFDSIILSTFFINIRMIYFSF